MQSPTYQMIDQDSVEPEIVIRDLSHQADRSILRKRSGVKRACNECRQQKACQNDLVYRTPLTDL